MKTPGNCLHFFVDVIMQIFEACREYDELKLRRDKEKENRKKQVLSLIFSVCLDRFCWYWSKKFIILLKDTSSQRRTNAIGRKEYVYWRENVVETISFALSHFFHFFRMKVDRKKIERKGNERPTANQCRFHFISISFFFTFKVLLPVMNLPTLA